VLKGKCNVHHGEMEAETGGNYFTTFAGERFITKRGGPS